MGISALLSAQILDASATGRSVITGADASAIRTTLGLGTLATQSATITDYLTIASAASTYQPLDSDLTSIAALSTTAFGRGLLTEASATTARSTLGLGTLATQSPTGTPSASTFLRGDFSWQTIDLSGYVPYTGATGAVNLGSNSLTAGAGTFNGNVLVTAQTNNASLLRLNSSTGTGTAQLGQYAGGTTYGAIWFGNITAGNSNYAFLGNGTNEVTLNAPAGGVYLAIATSIIQTVSSSGVSVATDKTFGFGSDITLARDASDTLGLRRSTNAQRLNLYNTYTDASNYERLSIKANTAGAYTITSEAAGTGFARELRLVSAAGITLSETDALTSLAMRGTLANGNSGVTVDVYHGTMLRRNTGVYNEVLLDVFSNDPNTTGAALLRVRNSSNTFFNVGANGNVGIGTSSPTSRLHIAETWNNAATTFTGILSNVTDTASNAASLLMDLQVGGSSRFSVKKNGALTCARLGNQSLLLENTDLQQYEGINRLILVGGNAQGLNLAPSYVVAWSSSTTDAFQSKDLFLFRDAAQTLAQRNGTSPQVHRVYNTFTDASNYERAKIAWESNVLRIGTEKAGTGSARALELQTDGTTRLTVGNTGIATYVGRAGASGGVTAFQITDNINATFRLSFENASRIMFSGNEGSHILSFGGKSGSETASPFTERFRVDNVSNAVQCFASLVVSAVNVVTDTTTGTKIGTATTQKLGFFNATPVVQPTAVANATDAASVITQLNALLSRMRDLGLIAT